MKYSLLLLLIICHLNLVSCNSNPANPETEEGATNTRASRNSWDGEYEDGTYCAEVRYYYSKTGTNSKYILHVDIEDGILVKIHWPNGGWLDETHFTPPDISGGIAHFTSDKDVDYTISIIGKEGDCYTSSFAKDEDDLEDEVEQREEEYQNRRDEEERIKQEEEEEQGQLREEEEEKEEERQRKLEEEAPV
jgi:hypothetical protein